MTVVVDVFRVISACTALVVLLSPAPSITNIVRNKSTGVASIVPLVSLFNNAHTIMMYGYLSEQFFPVFSSFVTGEILALIYISVFYYYSHEKPKAHKVFLLFGIPDLLMTVYAFLGGYGVTGQTRHEAGQMMGYLTILTSALYYTSPMERIGHVLRHRSAVFFNIQMLCAGLVNNIAWVTYSSMVGQWIIFSPNAFCSFMGFVQIGLYFIFHPSTHPLKETDADLEAGETAVESPGSGDLKVGDTEAFVLVSSPLVPLQQDEK